LARSPAGGEQTLAERINKYNAIRLLVVDRMTDHVSMIGKLERSDVIFEKTLEAVLGTEHEFAHA
jgi:hypothetical protein